MPPHLNPREVEAMEAILAQPMHPEMHHIARQFNTTYETVRYRRHQMRIRRAIGYDPRSKGGRPSIIIPEMEQRVLDHIALYNHLYQEEIIDFLYDEYGIKPSQSTIPKLLKRLKITRKQLKGIAAKQNQELIDQWHDNARF
jgi:transposase